MDAFLDMMEKHKMIVENAGLLPIAALSISRRGKNVVPVPPAATWMSSPWPPWCSTASSTGAGVHLLRPAPRPPRRAAAVAQLVAEANGNIIKLEHNQFVNINRQSGVELRVTLEAFGHTHKRAILDAPVARAMRPGSATPTTSTTEPAGAACWNHRRIRGTLPRIRLYDAARFLRGMGRRAGAAWARGGRRAPASSAWCILCARLRLPRPG